MKDSLGKQLEAHGIPQAAYIHALIELIFLEMKVCREVQECELAAFRLPQHGYLVETPIFHA